MGPPPRVRNHRRIGESSRRAKTNKDNERKLIYEKSNIDVVSCRCWLSCAFTRSKRGVSPAPDGCYPNFTTPEGCNALNSLSTGSGNTGLGWFALSSDSTGSFNTGVGAGALTLNNGDSNTAVGTVALLLNATGSNNTAVGTDALVNNTVDDNTATGFSALFANTIGGTLETSGTWVLILVLTRPLVPARWKTMLIPARILRWAITRYTIKSPEMSLQEIRTSLPIHPSVLRPLLTLA